jgi:PPOX class probable F420-dependent enzyme
VQRGRNALDTQLEELPAWARELIDRARVAHLGLVDSDDRPRVLPVTFAVAEGVVWSAVDDKPKRVPGGELARVRWIRRRPEVALTVDLYDDDWERLAWVQVLAVASVVAEPPPAALEALRGRYAQYREAAPGGPFIRLDPERFVCWRASSQSS